MFPRVRRIGLDDGRELVVMYQGEGQGWGAHVADEEDHMASAATPLEAITLHLGSEHVPSWASDLSDGLLRELAEAPRYACECCGYLTLLNVDEYEICDVCRWEDDRGMRRPGGESGPNHMTLTQARENFAAFGAVERRLLPHVRNPKPEEVPPQTEA